ncbi:hypothetical protein OIO90_004405 [Microbotryomycetes sp. JL221]|nr:hypothetical protein OIO90_004405 [Microbotryomycetes sp. JL221]
MPARTMPQLYLCVDGGGTSVKVAIADAQARIVGRGTAGPCNVKTVGYAGAIDAILQATYMALRSVDSLADYAKVQQTAATANGTPPMDVRVFQKVWLGLAGIGYVADIEAFAPFVKRAFAIPHDDSASLKITNDGDLLAASCILLPHVDSTVAIIAGTGTKGLAFVKAEGELHLVGVSGGWGYLLGDEGSAYAIARLAIRFILDDDDARHSPCYAPTGSYPPTRLPLISALMRYFGASSPADLIDRTYSDHSLTETNQTSSFAIAESNRKVWIAEAARVVFAHAFGDHVDDASRIAAMSIVQEGVQPLVKLVSRLVGDRSTIVPTRAALSLGGGLWKVPGYSELLLKGLREAGINFAETFIVNDAPGEGAKAVVKMANEALDRKLNASVV